MPPNSTRTFSTDNNATSRPPEKPEVKRKVLAYQAPSRELAAEGSSEAQQRVEPDRESGRAGDLADREQDTRHERRAVVGVVPDRQGLARRLQQDLLMGDHASNAQRVD